MICHSFTIIGFIQTLVHLLWCKSHKCLLRAGECPILSVGGFCHSLSDLMCALGGTEPPAEVYKHFVPQVQEGPGQKLELTSVNV